MVESVTSVLFTYVFLTLMAGTYSQDHPVITSVALRGPEIPVWAPEGSFSFFCDFGYDPTSVNSSAVAKITFLFDGVEMNPNPQGDILRMESQHVAYPGNTAELNDDFLRGRLGTQLSCMVQSYWEAGPSNLGYPISSAQYFIGVTIETDDRLPTALTIERPSAELRVVATVPVLCHPNQFLGEHCAYDIVVLPSSGLSMDYCSYRITDSGDLRSTIPVSADMNNTYMTTHTGIEFQEMMPNFYLIQPGVFKYPIWRGYKPEAVNVSLVREETYSCPIMYDEKSVFPCSCTDGALYGANRISCSQSSSRCDVPLCEIGDPRRSTEYELSPSDQAICDSYNTVGDVWYSFRSSPGSAIPERAHGSAIEMNRCGTLSPIWIQGTDVHPADYDTEVTSSTCMNTGSGCDVVGEVTIRRCPGDGEDFFIYRLPQLTGCSSGFCAGEHPTCDHGMEWDSSDRLCRVTLPPLPVDPILRGPEIPPGAPEGSFSFFCDVTYSHHELGDNAMFEVTFLFDGREVVHGYSEIAQELNPFHIEALESFSAEITETYLVDRLGTSVSCQVKSYWQTSPENKSKPRESNGYFVGINVESTTSMPLDLTGAEATGSLKLVPTIPVLCHPNQFMSSCQYNVQVSERESAGMNNCLYSVFSTGEETYDADLIPVNVRTGATSVTSQVEFVPMEPSSYFIEPGVRVYPLWRNYQIANVQILTATTNMPSCYTLKGSSITTFDGRLVSCYDAGDFYLAKSSDDRRFMVQSSHWRTSAEAKMCGVSVREGSNVITLSMCRSKVVSGHFALVVNNAFAENEKVKASVHQTENEHTVYMPSGARVVVTDMGSYIDVAITPSSRDQARMYGMCGNFDGDMNNDDPLNGYCRPYSVTQEENLFIGHPGCQGHQMVITGCHCTDGGVGGRQSVTCDDHDMLIEYPCI